MPSTPSTIAIWEFTTLDGAPYPEDEQPFVQVCGRPAGLWYRAVLPAPRRLPDHRVNQCGSAEGCRPATIVGEVATLDRHHDAVQEVRRREQSEEALRKSVATNRALLDAMPDLMFRIRRRPSWRTQGRAGRQPGASAKPRAAATTSASCCHPAAARGAAPCGLALATSETQVFEYQLPTRAASATSRPDSWSAASTRSLAIIRDISERKAADRLKNEFISTVSHELRTPLTSILGSLGLVTGGVAGEVPAQARAMLEIAHKNSERLVRLINDILDIEKIESGKMASTSCRRS